MKFTRKLLMAGLSPVLWTCEMASSHAGHRMWRKKYGNLRGRRTRKS